MDSFLGAGHRGDFWGGARQEDSGTGPEPSVLCRSIAEFPDRGPVVISGIAEDDVQEK